MLSSICNTHGALQSTFLILPHSIVETCLGMETVQLHTSKPTDWNCLCVQADNVLTCYDNCPSKCVKVVFQCNASRADPCAVPILSAPNRSRQATATVGIRVEIVRSDSDEVTAVSFHGNSSSSKPAFASASGLSSLVAVDHAPPTVLVNAIAFDSRAIAATVAGSVASETLVSASTVPVVAPSIVISGTDLSVKPNGVLATVGLMALL